MIAMHIRSQAIAEMRCSSCGAMNQTLNAFCGTCGVVIQGPVAATAAHASSRGRYRGPRRLLIAGAVTLIIGAPAAIASFSTVQGKGVSGFALDIAVPAINLGLGIASLGHIQETAGGDGASMIFVVTFIVGVMLASFGACLLLWGAIWMLIRYSPRARGEKIYRRAQPITSELAHTSSQQIVAAVERGQQEIVKARPKVARAAGWGRETIKEDVLPLVSASTERGRKQWFKAAPKIRLIAMHGRRRIGQVVTRRQTISADTAPTSPAESALSEPSPDAFPTRQDSEVTARNRH